MAFNAQLSDSEPPAVKYISFSFKILRDASKEIVDTRNNAIEQIEATVRDFILLLKNIPEKFSTDYDSVVVFGTIKKCVDKKNAITKIIAKYCPSFIKEGDAFSCKLAPVFETYEISIEHITAKARRLQ